ncbi:hypothetical protein D3260_02695 [Salinisphaera sp. Q1T1-3]|nr:hypothetical protein D3260_02695 [Salinisphaera sp. Q1T1-3]
MKRLRHHRRDLQWRRRFSPPIPGSLDHGVADPRCPDFAIGAIAVSRKYADWCLTMLQTLRDRGSYQGPVYVVTDHPAMFADLANVFCIEVPYSRVRLLSKSLKPMLFEWLPQRYVAYVDADVIVTGPIADWYDNALQRLDEVDSPLLTYKANNPVADSFHGGLLFAEREAALPFLRRWLAMLRSGRYLSDQVALRRVATDTTPAYYADAGFSYLYRVLDGERDVPPTFVHITDRMIKDHPPQALRTYLSESLGVARLPDHFGS